MFDLEQKRLLLFCEFFWVDIFVLIKKSSLYSDIFNSFLMLFFKVIESLCMLFIDFKSHSVNRNFKFLVFIKRMELLLKFLEIFSCQSRSYFRIVRVFFYCCRLLWEQLANGWSSLSHHLRHPSYKFPSPWLFIRYVCQPIIFLSLLLLKFALFFNDFFVHALVWFQLNILLIYNWK